MVGVSDADRAAFKGSFGKSYEKVGASGGGSTRMDKNILLQRAKSGISAGMAA